MVGGHLFPLWKRGIKGDLTGWWEGFLCSMGTVLRDEWQLNDRALTYMFGR
jgi:hypothetical protein